MDVEVYEPGGGTQWIGVSEFEEREFLASGIPDISICDELLLPGNSPYRLDHNP